MMRECIQKEGHRGFCTTASLRQGVFKLQIKHVYMFMDLVLNSPRRVNVTLPVFNTNT